MVSREKKMNFWLIPSLCIAWGILWAMAFLSYTKAFHLVGSPTLSLSYFFRLAFTTPFFLGLGLAVLGSFLRMWLFGQLGPQRTWFLEPVAFMVSSLVLVSVLREGMRPIQWVGALGVTLGMFLLLRK
jgi:drug/metabolite transporter (DMT)-like permease